MLSVDEAQQKILHATNPRDSVSFPLSQSLGLILDEDITSDLDLPPYDKALMDGFAVRTQDLSGEHGVLAVVGEIVAGQAPWGDDRMLAAGQAARIMTGAPMPPGADAVVMLERTTTARDRVTICDDRIRPGQNIMGRGVEMTRGQVVLRAGTRLRPQEIGVLAAVGRATISVYPRPRVAIVSTGNEIVEADETPSPGQIRNSNGPTIAALVSRAGGTPEYLGIARDTLDELRRLVTRGLEADIVVLSGGVSAGDLDLVPGVLRELGVREVFHKVNLKPGKPVWFGRVEGRESRVEGQKGVERLTSDSDPSTLNAQLPTLVFGLPGNPVSVMVCFELFVRPAIRRMMGLADAGPKIVWSRLDEERTSKSDRPTYWPAWLETADDEFRVRLVAWKGSPDLRSTTEANAFAIFPPGEHQFRPGDQVQVLCTEY